MIYNCKTFLNVTSFLYFHLMCKAEYEEWCENVMKNLPQYIHFTKHLDPSQADMVLLAREFNWNCPCHPLKESVEYTTFTCDCREPHLINDFNTYTEVCAQCGISYNGIENRRNQISFCYEFGMISLPTFYSATKNFLRFLSYFQYPITIHISKSQYRELMLFLHSSSCDGKETSVFKYLKRNELTTCYEYIPRLLAFDPPLELLSKDEVTLLAQEYNNFSNFYSTFRVKEKRKSLPHRGFLFYNFCTVLQLQRFQPFIRLPKLIHTQTRLSEIWEEYLNSK